MESEPLLGIGYVRRETYTAEHADYDPLPWSPSPSERRESSDSTMSAATRRWAWKEDEPAPAPVPAPSDPSSTVGSTNAPKKTKFAALVKWTKEVARSRNRYEREWNRP